MDVDLEELASIIELLDKTDFTQFRFEKGDLRIAVSRGAALSEETHGVPTPVTATVAVPAAPAPPGAGAAVNGLTSAAAPGTNVPAAPASPAAPPAPSGSTAATTPSLPHLSDSDVLVRAPMLGTFYRSPKPGDPSFVDLGSVVEADTVLCILEVMKLMNSVVAGTRGVITQVLIHDGELVDFDQPLFVISQTDH